MSCRPRSMCWWTCAPRGWTPAKTAAPRAACLSDNRIQPCQPTTDRQWGKAPWVAFEVDEVEGPFDWRSVVVHGTVYVLQDGGGEIARETYRVALGRIRQLIPTALTPRDPTPTRQVVIKLHLTDMRGRSASSSDSG